MKATSDAALVVGDDVEKWRDIPGGGGVYGVSDVGGMRSRRGRNGKPIAYWRTLKPFVDAHGCPRISLTLRGERTNCLVSWLVADAFLPAKAPTDEVVRHLNDDPSDNRACNLARGTYSDNMTDSMRNKGRRYPTGIACYNAKLTENQVLEIRRLYATENFSKRELARRFGVSDAMIGKIVRRQAWRHI